ncbi:MAG TPA: hypothetical protein G4O16_10560 [Dehalococcoidia bacterium]|nr:hypothetical protein [Dehalococcoidia bacterium]
MKPAIVLGMRVNGLGVMRGLGRKRIEAYGIDKDDGIAFSSKYCKRKYLFADPEVYPTECLNQFIELGKSLGDKAVLLPTSDPYLAFLSKYRDELSQYYLFNIPDATILENMLDKRNQYKLAARLGIAVPKTISPERLDDLKEDSISYPAIIKGVFSKKWSCAFDANGFVAYSYDELSEYFKQALDKNVEVIIQEMIIGPNKNHYSVHAFYSKMKELLEISSFQRLRQFPIDMGDGTYIVIVNKPELAALGQRFLEAMGYTGIANIQFKYDERDSQFKLIELNPRIGMANILHTCAGVNTAYNYYLDCIGEKVAPALNPRENTSWLNLTGDISSFFANRKRGDLSFTKWIRSVFQADCFPYYARDDLRPICKRYVTYTKKWIKRKLGLKK